MNDAPSLKAKDFMSGKPLTFSPEMDLRDAVKMLFEHRHSGAPVVDERGNLCGILTERDYLKAVCTASYHHESVGRVEDYMSRDVQTVDANESLMDVAARFVDAKYRRYPVMDENRLVGIISRSDVLRALLAFA